MPAHKKHLRQDIETAARLLQQGGVVAFPTDTLYGLGADAWNEGAVRRLLAVKERPADLGIPLLLASMEDMERCVSSVPEAARRLAAAFWPGALTLVLPRAASVPDVVTGGRETVAVRVPDHFVPRYLAAALGRPITGTSANKHGAPNPRSAEEVRAQLGDGVDMVVDGGTLAEGVPSTIVAMEGEGVVVLRAGAISEERILAVLHKRSTNGRGLR